jgi:hypothetical protein
MLNLLSILLGQADGTYLTHKPTNSGCLFLQLLNLDSRFQIYKHFVPNPQAVQVINICQPEDSGSKGLTALLSTNHEIRHEVLLWYSQNMSWLTQQGPRGNVIQLLPTVQNTKYYLKWTSDFGCSQTPSTAVLAWHQFCFHNSTQSSIGPLVVEFHLPSAQEVLSAFGRLFSEPYRIEIGRRRARTGRIPIAVFLTSIEVILPLVEHKDSQAPIPPDWKWDEKLDTTWETMWHNIGGCGSTVWKCGGLESCSKRRRARRPKLSWTML